ncbi:hypothetical protein [Cellulomonas alba]|uniref:Lipoprotein n=1 Tax=Cellulomonas alba TaxID=3053467 RepID=A0ABT7SHJ8_9CELL|nr:hypothetical protein [Cellulomonas alba]MDM7855645.1 hypothetical protein [Cellulomonas alba]
MPRTSRERRRRTAITVALAIAVMIPIASCAKTEPHADGSAVATAPTNPASTSTAELVVEIHVPLAPDPDATPGAYPFPWIDTVEDYLAGLDGSDGAEYDDGEEYGDEYLFFVAGAPEAALLELARRVALLPDVPVGVYAVVTDTVAPELGVGRRVELGEG